MAKQRPPLTTKTVYPPPEVYEVLGERSPELNEALVAWAGLIAVRLRDLEQGLEPSDWQTIAIGLSGKRVRPLLSAPGAALLEVLRASGLSQKSPLRTKIQDLDFAGEWAVVLLCRWYERNHRKLNLDGQEWWKREFRQAPG